MRKNRSEYVEGLLSALVVRAEEWLAARHLRRGYPQLAVFAFDHIGARINTFGRYEHDELAALVDFLRRKNMLRGACIDAGANIGNHAVVFANLFDQVHAFEPAPRPFALLKLNTRDIPNVHCHEVGLSDRTCLADLIAPRTNVGGGSVEAIVREDHLNDRDRVSLVQLDRYQALAGLDVGLMKIDVEGHELAVLNGAAEMLSNTRPVIVFEQQAGQIVDGSSAVIDRLRALGYGQFYEFVRSPQTRLRPLTIVLRLLIGETLKFERVTTFEKKYYAMLLATA